MNWLIKHRVSEGSYFFIDHDCMAKPGMLRELTNDIRQNERKPFVFPRHESDSRSLTAPLFHCEPEVHRIVDIEIYAQFPGLLRECGFATEFAARFLGTSSGADEFFEGCAVRKA